MATTIVPYDAIQEAALRVKNLPIEDIAVDVANDIHARIWNAGNWNWTVNSVSVNCNPSVAGNFYQEYNLSSNLTDCFRFIQGRLVIPVRGASSQVRSDTTRLVDPVSYLYTTAERGLPTRFQYVPGGTDKIRFDVNMSESGATLYAIYKKNINVLNEMTMFDATKILLPDEWYYVYREGVLWKMYAYANDNRAGGVTVADGRVQYTGQLAVFMAALEDMKRYQPVMMLDSKDVGEKAA